MTEFELWYREQYWIMRASIWLLASVVVAALLAWVTH